MSSVLYNFPPESYSAVYTSVDTINVEEKCDLTDSSEVSSSTPSVTFSPTASIFSCFHCTFTNRINFCRRKDHKQSNFNVNGKDYDNAYDYSEVTIKPQGGTNIKPLNLTTAVTNDILVPFIRHNPTLNCY